VKKGENQGGIKMGSLAIIAMICGPISTDGTVIKQAAITNCYKQLLVCTEHKRVLLPEIKEDEALKECVLEF
jgi:hypothetical protein